MNDLAPAGITPAFVPPYGGGRVEIEGSRHELTKIYRRAKYYWVGKRVFADTSYLPRFSNRLISVAYAPSGFSFFPSSSSREECERWRLKNFFRIRMYI